MERLIKFAEKYNETRIWVFLDEFNTCDSISLLTELICDRNLLGVRIPNNIVLTAACNPFRYRTKKEL